MMPPMLKTAAQMKKLKKGDSLVLKGASYEHKQALYHLAYRVGIKVSIRETPDGTRLWRVE